MTHRTRIRLAAKAVIIPLAALLWLPVILIAMELFRAT